MRDFCRFLCEFPMIFSDFCYPDPRGQNDADQTGSGSTSLIWGDPGLLKYIIDIGLKTVHEISQRE